MRGKYTAAVYRAGTVGLMRGKYTAAMYKSSKVG